MRALPATTAPGCTPGACSSSGLNSCDTRAKYAYGLSLTMRGSAVALSSAGATITAAAPVSASLPFSFRDTKKVISPAPARSSEPTWRIRVSALPATRPPRREAICASVSGSGMPSLRRRLAAFERLDHLVGDVDARADIGRHLLEDDVELL